MSHAAVGPGAAWQVIRSREFGPYFLGNAASASGTWFQNLAASILVYRLTHSPFLLGVLNLCQFAPVLLFTAWTGSLADRFDRRRLLLMTQPAAALLSAALAGLAWNGRAGTWTIVVFSAALGVTTAFSNPAQAAMVGSLVSPEELPQAIALNTMTFSLARAIGPATAAGVIAAFGVAPAFAVNSFSYLLLAAGIAVVRPTPVAPLRRAPLRESLRLVRGDPRLAAYLGVVMAVSFAADPVNTEAPTFAHAFGFPPVWSGAVVGCFGLGAVAAALVAAGRVTGSRRRMAMTLTLLGAGITLVAASPWLPLGCVFLVVAGVGYLASNASATSRLQLAVAESQRGRIMALWSVAFLGIRPLASICDGALAGSIGIRLAAPVMALPALAAAAALARRRKNVVHVIESNTEP